MRLARTELGRPVLLPATWPDAAAEALAQLLPNRAATIRAADRWIGPHAPLRELLLLRRGAAGPTLWAGEAGEHVYTLHLAAFHDGDFDSSGLAEALETAIAPWPGLIVGLTGLDGLLGALGFDYASPAARETAAAIVASIRVRLRRAAPASRLAVLPAGPVDALLDVEAAGIAPAWSPLDPEGTLTGAARAWLAARGLSPEMALARLYAGDDPLPVASPAAHAAMHDALTPHLDIAPPRPATLVAMPDLAPGYTQKASVGGHRLYIRTAEQDGRLIDLAISPQRETPTFRALMDAVATAIGVGLRHGTPLDAYVEALLGASFGPAGAVEGDPTVVRATSMLDYVMRHLAATYSHRTDLRDPGDAAFADDTREPTLPLALPEERRLRLVSTGPGR